MPMMDLPKVCCEGILLMINNRLRIYSGPDREKSVTVLSSRAREPQGTTVPAGEVFEALADAIQYGRTWLKDFSDDPITLSNDLYEVIQAYQSFRRPSA